MEPQIILECAEEWYLYADRDLASAEYLKGMHPQPLEIICYHCQQSSEKYLKGYLVFNGIEEPPKTHNLDILRRMCADFEPSFSALEKACSEITRYGVQPRYPNEIRIEEHHMHKAIEYAKQIRDFAPLTELRKQFSNTTGGKTC